MKLSKPLLPIACLVFLTAGCACGPKYCDYRPTVPPAASGNGRIWFYRPWVLGLPFQPKVKLDNQPVATAVPLGFFYVEAKPGTHEVSATTEWTHKRQVIVTANADSYVRLNICPGLLAGHLIPKEVPECKGINDMKNLRLVAK